MSPTLERIIDTGAAHLSAIHSTHGTFRCPNCDNRFILGPVARDFPERRHPFRCTCGVIFYVEPSTNSQ